MNGARLLGLTAVVMVAFAGNSLLNRLALRGGAIDPFGFALWRIGAGGLVLLLLTLAFARGLPLLHRDRLAGAPALALYVLAFSFAYVGLDAGTGALVLFGGVQVTMFGGALLARETVPPRRWLGAALALGGLGWLLWPGGPVSLPHALLMAAAALGWGVYSLVGRRAGDPLAATAANFLLALPLAAAAGLPLPAAAVATAPAGIGLALVSGAVTSGLGYALWYRVLPDLGSARAGVAQLTVPVIAAAGGVALLGEHPTLRLVLAGAVVLAGVALATLPSLRAIGAAGGR